MNECQCIENNSKVSVKQWATKCVKHFKSGSTGVAIWWTPLIGDTIIYLLRIYSEHRRTGNGYAFVIFIYVSQLSMTAFSLFICRYLLWHIHGANSRFPSYSFRSVLFTYYLGCRLLNSMNTLECASAAVVIWNLFLLLFFLSRLHIMHILGRKS